MEMVLNYHINLQRKKPDTFEGKSWPLQINSKGFGCHLTHWLIAFSFLTFKVVGYLLLCADKACSWIPWPRATEVKGEGRQPLQVFPSMSILNICWFGGFIEQNGHWILLMLPSSNLHTCIYTAISVRSCFEITHYPHALRIRIKCLTPISHTRTHYSVSCSPYLCKLLLIRVNIG